MRDQTDSRTLPLPLVIPGIEVTEFFGPLPLSVFHGDGRAVLAKGAGPGIWNEWVRHCGGDRFFTARVRSAYLAGGVVA